MTLVWMVRRSGVARQDVNLSVVIHLELPVLGIATKLLIHEKCQQACLGDDLMFYLEDIVMELLDQGGPRGSVLHQPLVF